MAVASAGGESARTSATPITHAGCGECWATHPPRDDLRQGPEQAGRLRRGRYGRGVAGGTAEAPTVGVPALGLAGDAAVDARRHAERVPSVGPRRPGRSGSTSMARAQPRAGANCTDQRGRSPGRAAGGLRGGKRTTGHRRAGTERQRRVLDDPGSCACEAAQEQSRGGQDASRHAGQTGAGRWRQFHD